MDVGARRGEDGARGEFAKQGSIESAETRWIWLHLDGRGDGDSNRRGRRMVGVS